MSEHKTGLMSDQLSKPTSVFGLRLWVVLGVCVGTAIVLLLFFITLWLASKSKKSTNNEPKIPIVSKEIQEIRIDQSIKPNRAQMQTHQFQDQEMITRKERGDFLLLMPPEEESPVKYHGIKIDIGKGHLISYPGSSGEAPRGGGGDQVAAMMVPDVSHLGWGHWYTLRELEVATNSFAHEKVIGEGGYGIVYHGVLEDNTEIAVKNLLNNRGQAEREFKVEVEAIGRVRHKNLVRLLGYCAEGAQRMLVYEYVNSGNLEQWLHGDVGPCSPLTWEIRMKIILGTAKGYVAPEYASSGMLNESSDVYSFGILIMEIISGRNPVDYSRPPEEVNLIDWLKRMVSNRNPEGVLDPKLPEKPILRALKRALLVALRCVDPNAQKRPKMGHIVHMLEADDSPFREVQDRRGGRDLGHAHCDSPKDGLVEKQVMEISMKAAAH
ncbi:PREDICTED: probable serine/threonine-protein kinase At1g01540 isoform X3 [Populus euphratica]|uniref:non-specific serine/threonine protein kinase n=1 Tax=Populus euphratica TaxID=75702 RepID=A0AAJ6TBZ8_POPEU|nr:PREDICTED: probable serine/threonine-protein kinase At1g01540 isoform X3 [Populus euphratica]